MYSEPRRLAHEFAIVLTRCASGPLPADRQSSNQQHCVIAYHLYFSSSTFSLIVSPVHSSLIFALSDFASSLENFHLSLLFFTNATICSLLYLIRECEYIAARGSGALVAPSVRVPAKRSEFELPKDTIVVLWSR